MAQALKASEYYAAQYNLGASHGLRRQGPLTLTQRLPLGPSPAHIQRRIASTKPFARVASPYATRERRARAGTEVAAFRWRLQQWGALGESHSPRRRHRVSLGSGSSSRGGKKRLTSEVERDKARAAAVAAAAARSDGAPPSRPRA